MARVFRAGGDRVVVAVAAAAAVAIAGCTNRPYSIASLRIEGESAIPEAELRKAAGSCASAEECASDLENHYWDEGYIDSEVRPTEGFLRKITSSYSSLTVVEGPRYTMSALEIIDTSTSTDELGDPARLASIATLHAGDTFLREDLSGTVKALQRRYEEAGYANALITPITDLDQTTHSIKLRLEVTRGAKSPLAP